MSKIRIIMILILFSILPSCSKPIGQLTENDMGWTRAEMPMNYQAVYRNVNEGFRRCGSGLIAEGNLYTDIQEGHFDLYLATLMGGKAPGALGVINIKEIDSNHAKISIGIVNVFDNPIFGKKGKGRERFFNWANGIYECD